MTAYSLAVQADVRKRMGPPNRQDVPQIVKLLGIHRSTLYRWSSKWRLHGDTELSSYCLERGSFLEQVHC